MAEKVTMMKLKVDLDCPKCYKKVKKALRKFPQIRDELFDEKSNTIIIKVVCYDPERLMNKLCYKADGSIKSIVILEPPKAPQVQVQVQPSLKPKDPSPAPVQTQAPAPAPMWQPYNYGPYYEARQYECYGRPVYDNWGGGSQPHQHCCHKVSNQQSCFIM